MKTLLQPIKNQVLFLFLILSISFFASLYFTVPSYAISFDAGRIIDNIIFTNSNTMNLQSIQNFLNSKVPVCDTWGTQPSEFGGGTRAQWGAAHGTPPPYTCLKDYSENGKSPAQLIYETSQEFQINPQVLIVLLQKEQGLITDAWPLPIQYRSATGYGCPDTAACDSQYYGITNQIRWSGHMFRAILDNSPTWYTPYILGNNYIQYSPNAACGGSIVNIENSATQALYNYTPYQPNQAALNANYGTGDSCSSHGNRNFYLYFTDWFGATTNSKLRYSVIQGPNSSSLYLETSAGKYYIPSGELMQSWGIDKLPIQQVSQAYIDSLATGPWLGKLLKDEWNNYFVVENGKTHYVRDTSYLSLLNIKTSDAVQSLGLSYTLKSDTWLGRFVKDSSQPNGPIWLLDNGKKHLIPSNDMLYQWRYTPDQLTTVSTAFLDSITTDAEATLFATTGSSSFVINAGKKLSFNNSDIQNAYFGSQTPVTYNPNTLSFLPSEIASQFTISSSNGQWFMLEDGKRHYIGSAGLAELWGKAPNTPMTTLSDGFLSLLPNAGDLSNIVQTANPSMYWVTDGEKHYIGNSDIASAWILPNTTPPTYSTSSLNLLPRGADMTTTINAVGSPYYYTMDAGVKRYLMSSSSRSGWGGSVTSTTRSLVDRIPEGSFLNYVAKNISGQAYLLMNNKSYLIDPAYYTNWGISAKTPIVADSTISRYTPSGVTLNAFININNNSYMMVAGSKAPIINNYDAYNPMALGQTNLPNDYFNTTSEATYLAKSTDIQDKNIWLINSGKKHLFSNFETYVSYGYLSRSLPITPLAPESLSIIPTANEAPGLFIRTANSYGIKFINFGTSLGFPDGNTLFNLLGSTPVLIVSDSIYNSFPLVGSVSRILKDDAGNLYLVENGKKRWITNGRAYSQFSSIPITYLYGTTMALIPNGPPIE